MYQEHVRIGTMVGGGASVLSNVQWLLPYGFESFAITFGPSLGGADLPTMAAQLRDTLGNAAVVSTLSCFANPLLTDAHAEDTRHTWEQLIDAAHLFGTDLVTGFAGRVSDVPIDQSLARYAEVFGPLARRAADQGVRLAFENCEMGGNWASGSWNIAQNPMAWEMMFNSIPSENIGLQWEPCHQMTKLIDPIPQLRKWAPKIFNVHGKDASIMWDVIREYGIGGPKPFVYHRTPGFGDSNWTDIISILRLNGYRGSIDIEGWHDPVYRDELEVTGQVHALNYLKQCRGGQFVPETFK